MDEPAPPFNELLLTRRQRLGMSQQQVARGLDRLGHQYTAQTIGNWERGRSAPPREVVVLLEDVLASPGEFTAALGLAPAGRTPMEVFADRLQSIEREAASQRALIGEIQELVEKLAGAPRSDRGDS